MAAHPIVEAIDRGDADAHIPAVVEIALRRASTINLVRQEHYIRARFDLMREMLVILEKYRQDEESGKSDAEIVLSAACRIRSLMDELDSRLKGYVLNG